MSLEMAACTVMFFKPYVILSVFRKQTRITDNCRSRARSELLMLLWQKSGGPSGGRTLLLPGSVNTLWGRKEHQPRAAERRIYPTQLTLPPQPFCPFSQRIKNLDCCGTGLVEVRGGEETDSWLKSEEEWGGPSLLSCSTASSAGMPASRGA